MIDLTETVAVDSLIAWTCNISTNSGSSSTPRLAIGKVKSVSGKTLTAHVMWMPPAGPEETVTQRKLPLTPLITDIVGTTIRVKKSGVMVLNYEIFDKIQKFGASC